MTFDLVTSVVALLLCGWIVYILPRRHRFLDEVQRRLDALEKPPVEPPQEKPQP